MSNSEVDLAFLALFWLEEVMLLLKKKFMHEKINNVSVLNICLFIIHGCPSHILTLDNLQFKNK